MIRGHEHRIVNIDMDSTIFDFEYPLKLELARLGIAYADPTLDFYISKRYDDPEIVTMLESIHNSEGFFLSLPPIEGAIEAWHTIQELGFYPRINSKPLRSNPHCREEKLASIDYYFGPTAADEAYIGSDKESEPGIALIDDRPGLHDGKTWKRVIFTQPWNAHEQDWRLESWHDSELPNLLAACAARYDRLFG